jgi:hypothetical protein
MSIRRYSSETLPKNCQIQEIQELNAQPFSIAAKNIASLIRCKFRTTQTCDCDVIFEYSVTQPGVISMEKIGYSAKLDSEDSI